MLVSLYRSASLGLLLWLASCHQGYPARTRNLSPGVLAGGERADPASKRLGARGAGVVYDRAATSACRSIGSIGSYAMALPPRRSRTAIVG